MEIEKIARKLEPLMPEKIQHWLNVRGVVDADLKALLDKQIMILAQKTLGDYRKKILLSLPPQNTAKGSFHLGEILYEKEKWPVGISSGELVQNLAIFGRSGAGKTNITFHLLEQLVEKRVPFLYLDWKRTARHLLPQIKKPVQVFTPGRSLSPFPFNPFIPPPGIEKHLYINHLVDVLGDAYTLGDGAKSILQRAIAECYQRKEWPTVEDVLKAVESLPGKERAGGWKITTVRALQSLKFAGLEGKARLGQQEMVHSLCRSNTIVELDGLNQGAKKFLIPMLCLWLYYFELGQSQREQLKLAIFVEEAHHVFYRQEGRTKESVMNMLMRQCREMGIAMLVIDQHAHLISSAVLGNTYTTICLNQKDPSDINRAAGLCLLEDSEKNYLSLLPVGQGIVKLQDRWRRPFLVQFPLVPVKKGAVTDDILRQYIRDQHKKPAQAKSLLREIRQVPKVHDQQTLQEREFSFLQDVLNHPDEGVKARYKQLGISTGMGNALKEELVERGWLESEWVSVGNSRKLLLRISKQGREALGINRSATERGSLVHEYCKRYYAGIFQSQGYQVSLEAPRMGGKVDVLAIKDGKRIGIEIETGKSDIVGNVKNCLRSSFDKVLVVATDEKALEKVERQLAKAGLIIPSKVRIVLKDYYDEEDIVN